MDFLEVQDQVFSYYAENFLKEEIEEAKLEFIKLSGPFDEEDELLEEKMTHFREWFLFDFKIKDQSVSSHFKMEDFNKLNLSESDLDLFLSSEKTLFTYIKEKKGMVYVKCLFTGKKVIAKDSPYLAGFEKGTYFQARIFKGIEESLFGQSIITHPIESKKFIDKKIKLIKKEMKKIDNSQFLKNDFLKELFSMRYHLLKYKQLEVTQIYSDTSPIKELLEKNYLNKTS